MSLPVVCPKCGKDFSNDKYRVTAMRRHLARKNPCDRSVETEYVREVPGHKVPIETIRCLDSVKWETPIPPPKLPVQMITPWFFRQVMKDKFNVCFVKPNRSKNEIWIKITKEDPVRIVKMDEFIKLFVNHVLLKHFPRDYENYYEYCSWLQCENGLDLDDTEWDGITGDDKAEFLVTMRETLTEFVDTYPSKISLKNMIMNFI